VVEKVLKTCEMEYMLHNPYCSNCNTIWRHRDYNYSWKEWMYKWIIWTSNMGRTQTMQITKI